MDRRANLGALFDTRRAVRGALAEVGVTAGAEPAQPAPLVLVALSGGADSLALAAAVAFEAGLSPRKREGSASTAGAIRAGAVIVDHGLQAGSAEVAEQAAAQARELGLDPVLVRRVEVAGARVNVAGARDKVAGARGNLAGAGAGGGGSDGPEAAAREARYGALLGAAEQTGAAAILTAHTRDDQAEQVLLALARGSGLRSMSGIPPRRSVGVPPAWSTGVPPARSTGVPPRRPVAGEVVILRPFLTGEPEITRTTTELACAAEGLVYWSDPQNSDPVYTRVRVRDRVLPMLERELGPGVAAALARTADLAREDADALDEMAEDLLAELMVPAPAQNQLGAQSTQRNEAGGAVTLHVAALAKLPVALRNRVIRRVALREFGAYLSREHTRTVAALVTDWRGQGPIDVPGIVVARDGEVITLSPRR